MTTELTPNVTGIVPYLPDEVDEFTDTLDGFRRGEQTEGEFQFYRLRRGVYGQRQADEQMVRIKIPLGYLTAEQLEVLGRVIARYAPLRKGHFTTRENLQLHHVPLDETPELLRLLGTVDLTTREACGNTVRNVTGCPLAGVCPDEVFDATPYGAAYARYFVRRDFVQNMPRKVKTAFVGCREDHAVLRMHDIGFAGVVREEHGRTIRGFRMVVGGGTSIEPIIAPVLYDFVTADDGAYLRVAEAALRIYNRSDELRKNRMRARIKVLIKRIGIDEFRERVEQELEEPWAQEPIDMDPLLSILASTMSIPESSDYVPPPKGNGSTKFLEWVRTNVVSQKQPGFYGATVTLPAGDINPEQCSALAVAAREHGAGEVRIAHDQNLVIRWVPGASLHGLWESLLDAGLGESGARTVTDVVSCPGTDSCKLGITASMGLNRAVRQVLLENPEYGRDRLVSAMHIKISGCPNGCGQHHIADLGFHGAAVKGDQKMHLPAYEVFAGGMYEDSQVRYGMRLKGRVPAKNVPAAVGGVLDFYREEREPDEVFPAFVDRVGKKGLERVIAEFTEVPSFDPEHLGAYQDWERTGIYKVERGEGECAS